MWIWLRFTGFLSRLSSDDEFSSVLLFNYFLVIFLLWC